MMTTATATHKEGMRAVRAGEISEKGPKAPPMRTRMLEGVRDTYRVVRDNVQAMGTKGKVTAAAVALGTGLACGGSTAGPTVEETETPAGVCSDLQGRVIRIGTTELALDEAALRNGATVKLGGEQYVLEAVMVTVSGALCSVKEVATGNPAVVITNGETINEDFVATPGSTWKVVFPDGKEIEVTLCGIIPASDGTLYAVFKSGDFYWCNSYEGLYSPPRETYESAYGTETIRRVFERSGQTADEGREVECAGEIVTPKTEDYTFANPIMPGTQGYDMHIRFGGQRVEVIELSTAGYILLGTSEAAQDLTPGGEALVSESTGISVKVNRIYTMVDDGATYLTNTEVKVNGVTFTVESGAAAGTLIEVDYTDADGVERTAYVRVLSVTDGVAKVDIITGVFRLEDGGTIVDAEGTIWRVSLKKVDGEISNGVDGAILRAM
jgi:hypothetical protein